MFCGIPFTSRTRLEGHAVRAMYACCGATDYYLETGGRPRGRTPTGSDNNTWCHQATFRGHTSDAPSGPATKYSRSSSSSGRQTLRHDGTCLKIQQRTNYPWSGEVKITVSPETPSEFAVYVRIPGWSTRSDVKGNGELVEGARPGEYLAIRRRWSADDTVEMNFDMAVQVLKANPAVNDDRGRVAFQRGPIVFCMEQLDQADLKAGMNMSGYTVDLQATRSARFDSTLLNG